MLLKFLVRRRKPLTAFDNLVAKIKSEAVIMPFAKVNDSLKYIVDIETNKIVWMDEGLINKVGSDKTGSLCFEVLQGCTHPCDFCTNHKLIRENEVIQWIHYNEKHKRTYLVRDFMKVVDDRKLRYEMAIDISKHINEIIQNGR
jgi:hypothetical protein